VFVLRFLIIIESKSLPRGVLDPKPGRTRTFGLHSGKSELIVRSKECDAKNRISLRTATESS